MRNLASYPNSVRINFPEWVVGGDVTPRIAPQPPVNSAAIPAGEVAISAAVNHARSNFVQALGECNGELDWTREANCLSSDPDMFFPNNGATNPDAVSICEACGVRKDCEDYSLGLGEVDGIWGGLSMRQRNKILRRAR